MNNLKNAKYKMCTVFMNFETVHKSKDVGMIPFYFGSKNNGRSSILHSSKVNIPNDDFLDFINLGDIGKILFYLKSLITLVRTQPEVVNLYHIRWETLVFGFILKFIKFKSYLKADLDILQFQTIERRCKVPILKWLYSFFLSNFALVSVETKAKQEKIKSLFPQLHNILLIPNGVAMDNTKFKPKPFEEREKVLLIVGRIGAFQKNHEKILDYIEINKNTISNSDWKFAFVGPIENASTLSRLLLLSNICIYKGELARDELFELYAGAKVFLMSSRYEGFSLAMSEAAYMGAYIITTNIGGASEVTLDGKLGTLVEEEDNKAFAKALDSLFNGDLENIMSQSYEKRLCHARSFLDLEKIIQEISSALKDNTKT